MGYPEFKLLFLALEFRHLFQFAHGKFSETSVKVAIAPFVILTLNEVKGKNLVF